MPITTSSIASGVYGSWTVRDESYPLVAAGLSEKEVLQSLITTNEGYAIDARAYGADPTGVADSAPAIELAVAAANTYAVYLTPDATGSSIFRRIPPRVWLPPGDYEFNTPAQLDSVSAKAVRIVSDKAVIHQGGGFPTGRWLIEIGTPGSSGGSPDYTTYAAPFWVDIEGLVFRDYDRCMQLGVASNNINLGRMHVRDCVFIGKDAGTSLAVRAFNRSADFVVLDCQWDNVRSAIEVQSVDRVYIERPRVQNRVYQDAADRQDFESLFTLRRGHIYGDGCTLNPPQGMPEDVDAKPVGWFMAQDYAAWAGTTDYAYGDMAYGDAGAGTKLYVCKTAHTSGTFSSDAGTYWAEVNETGDGPLSVWCNINISNSLFGGEGGGLVPCVWDIAAQDANPTYPRGVTIRDCTANTNTQCGYESLQYATGQYLNSSPIVLLNQIPNKLHIDNIKGGQTYLVAADYLKDSTPPTPWVATQTKPLEVYVNGVECSTFHNYSPSGGQLWKYSPNWVPLDLAIPTLTVNDISPFWPANCKVAQTANTSATTISLFYGVVSGQEFTLHITDEYTTIADGTYIKLAGSGNWTPGAGGGSITFYSVDGAVYEKSRSDFTP